MADPLTPIVISSASPGFRGPQSNCFSICLTTTSRCRGRSEKKAATLRGRTQINLFFEPSTRTQSSFEIAGKRLGADVMNMSVSSSSVKKGETLLDTAATLNAMRPDIIIVRHHAAGAVNFLARKVDCSVVNAGDGAHEHPTQALLDALTIRRAKGRIEGLVVAICGDILHSRVARSNIICLAALGAPGARDRPFDAAARGHRAFWRRGLADMRRARRRRHRDDAALAARADERRLSALGAGVFPLFRAGPREARSAKPDALVMHPGPMNCGVEIASDVADGAQSLIREQVEMGVAVRMAVLMPGAASSQCVRVRRVEAAYMTRRGTLRSSGAAKPARPQGPRGGTTHDTTGGPIGDRMDEFACRIRACW